MPRERVLICGAGVAGSIVACWLAKHDFDVVVIERSKSEQKAGQGIEIEEPALTVVRQMGILDKLNARETGETGFDLVDERSRLWGRFDVGAFSPTGALELMRGDLTEVLYIAANESQHVTYLFETTISSIRQTGEKVFVEMENRSTKAVTSDEFDFVIGADGQRSKTRQLVMGSPEQLNCYKPVGAYVAYFSIPKEEQDWPYSRCCHFNKSRVMWIRPVSKTSDTTSVYLIHVHDNIPALSQANAAGDRAKQKEIFADLYSGLGWEAGRVIQHMLKAENFYSDELVQVKLEQWSQGRVVLVGDAAWAPTPFTGEGNQLAIIGAWVLAQEMTSNRTPVGFQNYEKRLRTHVEELQKIPLWGYAPAFFCQKTRTGIWMFRILCLFSSWTVNFISWTGLVNSSTDVPKPADHPFDLEMDE